VRQTEYNIYSKKKKRGGKEMKNNLKVTFETVEDAEKSKNTIKALQEEMLRIRIENEELRKKMEEYKDRERELWIKGNKKRVKWPL